MRGRKGARVQEREREIELVKDKYGEKKKEEKKKKKEARS